MIDLISGSVKKGIDSMEVIIEEDGGEDFRTVYLDKDDICIYCEQQYGCPLIECLSNGLVEATSDIKVIDCAHYLKFDGM